MSDEDRFQIVQPPGWPAPKGYANGVLAPAGARVLAIAGQVAWDETGRIVSDVLHEQFAQCFRNVAAVLEAGGGRPEHLIRITYYVVDRLEYQREARPIGEHYRAVFGRHYPASTLVEVQALLEEGARVEVEATAALPVEPRE